MITLLSKLFGTANQRILKRLQKMVTQINVLEPGFQALTDEALRAKTTEFKDRLHKGESLDKLLPEAFATVRETSVRVLKMRHFDVQLIGGIALHEGNIAEMRMGEGKTLVATLPAYLNALTGNGVHIVTVNDYLAKRDAEWMGPIYNFLGLTTGVVLTSMPQHEKKDAYNADITYGTNNEFGFDYLRDNMVFSIEERVQRPLYYAIIDEADSILIDEARTPLIISGAAEDSSELYTRINRLIPPLTKQEKEGEAGDYTLEEKSRQAFLTETGHQHVEKLLLQAGLLDEGQSLYDAGNITLMHHMYAALRAHKLFHRDVDYIVQTDQIVIVDEHTGRTMPGRRWSDGLHQAIEAKEGVKIQNENQTLASITFQNYFRLYQKLSGMTGTADTEAYELQQIYGLSVVVIPTNKPVIRQDLADQIYLTAKEKFNAVILNIKECVAKDQPVLVGTASIETSEYLSDLLHKENIPHQVLNAKFHEKEAQIIAQAGKPGAVTIATNMAGRGTDIVLGGKPELEPEWEAQHAKVIAAGGLYIIGSERHESRRIDNQLRGRAGRQGDPGATRFYLSLQDNLMRIFASEWVANIMQRLGMKEGDAIEHRMVTKSIENAQRKVESRNFDIRKQLLEFDDVANDQRKVIYELRSELMAANDISEYIAEYRDDALQSMMQSCMPPGTLEEQWHIPELERQLEQTFNLTLPITTWLEKDIHLDADALRKKVSVEINAAYQEKTQHAGFDVMHQVEKSVLLQSLDTHWKDHLAAMDHLRQGIHLRGYAQKNPKQEYKRESFELFKKMLEDIKFDVLRTLSTLELQAATDAEALEMQRRQASAHSLVYHHDQSPALASGDTLPEPEERGTVVRNTPKVGRNDPCPCGSGKKYKQCHGRL
ncbi:MAG: preprotein translocase subunit SecA [Gammaproteobacteria bacterium]